MMKRKGSRSRAVRAPDLGRQKSEGLGGVDFCDPCLAEMLRVAERAAAEVAGWLASGPDFLRDLWDCGRCNRRTTVTRALFRHVAAV